MKNLLIATCLLCAASTAWAQSEKVPVFGEFGYGFGQTLFFGDMQTQLLAAYGGTFDPGTGNNLMMGFYVAPQKWKGLGVGSRIKGTFGASVQGENGDDYIFNFYNLAASLKYYALSGEFNRGLYARGSIGFGQFTSKRVNEPANIYKHQYAIGTSLLGGIGYTFPLKKTALSFEAAFDYSNRNGTIDGQGDATFRSGQLSGDIILSF